MKSLSLSHKQSGVALLTTLILLVVITLLGIQLASQAGSNKTLVQNQETRALTEQYAQNVVNQILSDVNHFLDPTTLGAVIGSTYSDPNFQVTYTAPSCERFREVAGYSLTATIVPYTNYYTFSVTVEDLLTGAATTIVAGAKLNSTADTCVI